MISIKNIYFTEKSFLVKNKIHILIKKNNKNKNIDFRFLFNFSILKINKKSTKHPKYFIFIITTCFVTKQHIKEDLKKIFSIPL